MLSWVEHEERFHNLGTRVPAEPVLICKIVLFRISWLLKNIFLPDMAIFTIVGQRGLAKQCRPRSDTTESGVRLGSTLFAIRLANFWHTTCSKLKICMVTI